MSHKSQKLGFSTSHFELIFNRFLVENISFSPKEFCIKGRFIPTLPHIDCASVLVTSLSMKLLMIAKISKQQKKNKNSQWFLVQYISSASQLIAALAVENCFDERLTRASHFLLMDFWNWRSHDEILGIYVTIQILKIFKISDFAKSIAWSRIAIHSEIGTIIAW